MLKNSFSILGEKMEELLKPYNFIFSYKNSEIIIKGNNKAYTIKYDVKNQMISLFDCESLNEDEFCKNISSWFFSEEITSKDVDDICKDFFEIIVSQKVDRKDIKKRSGKEEENIGIIFFMNRLANIFPSIKQKIVFERENSEKFRVIKFLNEEILPEVNKLLSNKNDNKVEKFFKLLENMYKNGNIDVRCIVSMGILNSIDEEKNKSIIDKYLSEELKNIRKASLKYK